MMEILIYAIAAAGIVITLEVFVRVLCAAAREMER